MTKSGNENFVIAKYEYTTNGNRISKNVDTDNDGAVDTVTEYVYDGAQVIEEYENGSLSKTYVYGRYIDEPITMTDEVTSQTYYFAVNQQYSTLAAFDENGMVVERYEYNPYGRTTVFNAEGTPTPDHLPLTPYLFTGRRFDSETGMYYFRARMWNTQMGRFVNRDPIGYYDGYNLYAGWFVNQGLDPLGSNNREVSEGTEESYIIANTVYNADEEEMGGSARSIRSFTAVNTICKCRCINEGWYLFLDKVIIVFQMKFAGSKEEVMGSPELEWEMTGYSLVVNNFDMEASMGPFDTFPECTTYYNFMCGTEGVWTNVADLSILDMENTIEENVLQDQLAN